MVYDSCRVMKCAQECTNLQFNRRNKHMNCEIFSGKTAVNTTVSCP